MTYYTDPIREDNCTICLNAFVEEEDAETSLTCRHTFHSECIAKWMHTDRSCPMCRQEVGIDLCGMPSVSAPDLENVW